MARQSPDPRRLGFTVDVTTAGLNLPANAPAPARQTESGRTDRGGSSAKKHAEDSRPLTGPPSLLGMAASFAGAMAKFAASGFKRLDERSHGLRMNVCGPCEHRQAKRCACCGCFIAEKAWLPHEDCPIGRWPV